MQFINNEIQSEAEKIIQLKANGVSILDIITEIYTDSFPDKTQAQGHIIGSAILEEIARFDSDYEAARENQDSFIINSLSNMNAGKTCAERCTFWLRISKVLQSASSITQESERENILDSIQNLSVSEEEATSELKSELMTKAADIVKNSPVMLSAFIKHSEELQESDDAAALLLDLGADEAGYRAVVSMLAYVAVKNGEIPDAPSDMTAEQVTSIVCAEIEQLRISEAVQNGSIAVDIASTLLLILGTVVLVHLVAAFTVFMSVIVLDSCGVLLAVPGVLMIAFSAVRVFGSAFEAWEEDSKTITGAVVSGASLLISGLKTLCGFIFKNLVPGLKTKDEEITPVSDDVAVSLA